MKVAPNTLLEKARQIPSEEGEWADSKVLSELYGINKSLYFDFCLSRFNQLLAKSSEKEDILGYVKAIFENESNENYFLPFLELILNYHTTDKIIEFVFRNLFTEKRYSVYYFVTSHPKLNSFIGKLVYLLFQVVPSESQTFIIELRDNLLFRYIDIHSDDDFVFKCIRMITPSFSSELYFEFLFLSSYLVNSGFSSKELCCLLINSALAVPEPNQIIQLIVEGKFKVPKLFVDWIEYKYNNKYSISKSRIYEPELNQLPIFLRLQMLQKPPSIISGPRLCRAIKFGESYRDEVYKRVIKEDNPKQLHDYLISLKKALPIDKSIPFYYTLLSLAALNEPDLSDLYISDFCKLSPNSNIDVLVAASIGLEKLSLIYNNLIPSAFPHIILLLKKCPKSVRIHLLNAIAYAVGSEIIDEEFIWREYHSIRTVSDNGLYFDDLIHYCIIGLNDPDEVEVAEPLLEKLLSKDMLAIISGLFRLPVDKVSPFNKLYSLLPDKEPIVNKKTDNLLDLTKDELKKELTTQRILQLATGFTMFFDVFKIFKEKWIQILVDSGECVFNMTVSDSYIDELKKELQESTDEKQRFSCGYSFALFLAYRLIEPLSISGFLKEHVLKEESALVILICLYALSYCPSFTDTIPFIQKMISKGNRTKSSSIDIYFGIGYCICSWFSSFISILQNNLNSKEMSLPGIWPFSSYILEFIGKQSFINTGDKVNFAQYVYLFRSDQKHDHYVDEFIVGGLEPDVALTALCGYVPNLSFRITSFAPDERQRKIISSISKETNDFEFLNQLLTRQRLYHKQTPHSVDRTQRTPIQILKSDFDKLNEDSINIIFAQLSENQIEKIVSDVNEDYSLFAAIYLRNVDYIANILSVTKPKEKFLMQLKKSIPNVQKLIEKMFEINSPVTRIAELIVYYNFEEVLSEDNNVTILPILLSEFEPNMDIIRIIKNDYHSLLNEYLQCLVLKHPAFIQSNEDTLTFFE